MRVLEVIDDSCGFRTRIVAQRKDRAFVTLNITSECEEVARWGSGIREVDWRECLGGNALQSHLWHSAFQVLKHRCCPVPAAVLRAVSAEVGAIKAAGVAIDFLSSENRPVAVVD